MKQNQYQRGAAGSFIIIAVVLTLVALTVLYGARQFMSQQSAPITAQDITPRSDQQTAQAPNATKPDATPQGSGAAPQQSTPQSPQSSQSSGAANRQTTTTPQQSTPRAEQPTPSSSAPSQHLPQTGPASAAVSAAGLATLTTLALLYVRSRRLV
ncbi:MAG: LPXTG cell wall anchor domain-containing protein [Candidatus Saccharibacteria bacterium]|nr:LPXTG cell wall anchor domain-containing protein [Candidatus Saccharibacteria bacterium]